MYRNAASVSRWLTVFVLVALAHMAAPSPALAVSAGCTAINGGALDRVVGAGTVLGQNVPLILERGDKLVVTTTGNPVNVVFDVQPRAAVILTTSGNGTVTVTIKEDGVTGIGFFIQAAAASNAIITV